MNKLPEITKSKQLYIPVHRRGTPESSPEQLQKPRQPKSSKEDVVRRGRGQFRAPSSAASTLKPQDREDRNERKNYAKPSSQLPAIDKAEEQKQDLDVTEELSATFEKLDIAPLSTSRQEPKQNSPEDSASEKEEWEQLLDLSDDEWELTSKQRPAEKERRRELSAEESRQLEILTNVIDCYDFPASFQTVHLHGMFRDFENTRGGYKIKWIHDTRALIIFEHPTTAREAYLSTLSNPQAKISAYTGPIDSAKSNNNNARTQSPPPRRPMTTNVVARRLVHNALGVRSPVRTPEQRKAEEEMLKNARDQKEARRQMQARRERKNASLFFD